MLIAAIVLALIGFILLVITLVAPSAVWTWLLIAVVLAGLVLFALDEARRLARRRNRDRIRNRGDAVDRS
ncbi:hypothetical protein [Corynebacterium pacaense]|uniref:hypothetical protein n=1 Tax=Corynebacterium pacaense TaxID=1816684 RepID=UPI0009B9FACB|nr:hypothetical protein [Corynebacterium pacaense]